MSYEDQQRAQNDVMSGRRDAFGSEAYQQAYRDATVSKAQGKWVGGAAGGALGLLSLLVGGIFRFDRWLYSPLRRRFGFGFKVVRWVLLGLIAWYAFKHVR